MGVDNQRILKREIAATLIPDGESANLPAGLKVDITHRLGGNFTVVCDFGMFRIKGKDADALGEELSEKKAPPKRLPGSPIQTEELWEALKTVFDPEIRISIVDLGLIYSVDLKLDKKSNTGTVDVKMTLTAPGCGMGPIIADDAKSALEAIEGITEATVEIVLDPPWNQDMISEEGKMELGLI